MTYFGTNLKKIRQIKGLSQQAFAELIDLNRGVISSYEEGRAEPKIETLLRIANYFGIPTDDIISKPLTVNQLANFELIEDSISSIEQHISPELQEIDSNGEKKAIDLQKIFAKFDLVYIVDKEFEKTSMYDENTVLFLKEVKEESNSATYLNINKQKITISNHFVPNTINYLVVGTLGTIIKNSDQTILDRLSMLEKKVFGA